jgi:nicotinate-nucleotide--dimethylbenzimidazole phosphoribosyltransferase
MSKPQLDSINAQIETVDHSWLEKAAARQLTLTKPPGSLGRLEEIGNRLAAIQRTTTPNVNHKRIYVIALMLTSCRVAVSLT